MEYQAKADFVPHIIKILEGSAPVVRSSCPRSLTRSHNIRTSRRRWCHSRRPGLSGPARSFRRSACSFHLSSCGAGTGSEPGQRGAEGRTADTSVPGKVVRISRVKKKGLDQHFLNERMKKDYPVCIPFDSFASAYNRGDSWYPIVFSPSPREPFMISLLVPDVELVLDCVKDIKDLRMR